MMRSAEAATAGRITFAMAMFVNTRSTQPFINYGDNSRKLDADGFAPFGEGVFRPGAWIRT